MMALVLLDIFFSIFTGSMLYVLGSMSTKTTLAPLIVIASEIALSISSLMLWYWAFRSTSGISTVYPLIRKCGYHLDQLRRVAHDDRIVRHIFGDDGSGADEGVYPNHDPGQDCGVRADLRAFFHNGSFEGLFHPRGKRVFRVRQAHVGPQPCVVLDDGEFRHEDLAVHPHVVPDPDVVLDHRQGADTDVVSDLVRLPNVHLVSGLEIVPDPVPGVDHRVGPDDRSLADYCLELA